MSANLSKFVKESHINESLIRAVVRQSGGWESFQEMAQDVANHGADAGFGGWTYYTDTVKFAKAHKQQILQACTEMASDIGEKSAFALIAGFNCLKMEPDAVAEAIYNPRSDENTNVFNALAWFALEEVSRAYSDSLER